MRVIWIVCGATALAVGIVGMFLPLLPTVVFLLIAAFCFARSSRRLHDWLLAHPRLGPPITDWQRSGAIRRSAKWASTVSMIAAVGLSFLFGVPGEIIIIQVVTMIGVAVFIWTRPEA